MNSSVAWSTGHRVSSASRAARGPFSRSTAAICFVAAAALGTSIGCSNSDTKTEKGVDGGGGDGAVGKGSFAQCIASLTPLCKTKDMNTAEKMQIPCKATQFIPIPLSDGTSYGPVTIQGGPYGAKIDWNQGAGSGFENPVNMSEPGCLQAGGGIDLFQEPTATTDDLKNTRDLKYELYTIFRPACLKDGETYPVITWANGTCGLTHGYALLLGTVASYGFVVVASNSSWTATAPTDKVQERAIDYAEALNEDSTSVLYHKLDLDKVGAMGHSQGALATINGAKDARVKSVIFWNSGASNDKPFLNVSGDRDVGGGSIMNTKGGTEAATQPGAWVFYHQILQTGGVATGHLVLMEQPDRVWKMAVAWWQWQLNGDDEAKKMFIGDSCGLCGHDDEYEYGHNTLLE